MRLSTKQVLWCGITALLLSAMSIALIVIPLKVFDNGLLMWAPTASMALAPLPLVIGALGLACQRDLLPPSHTSWAAAISTLSLILGAIAQVSWTAAIPSRSPGVSTYRWALRPGDWEPRRSRSFSTASSRNGCARGRA